MPSIVWSGSISFGLVSVPVKMTSATVNRDVSFNQIEAGTGSRIRMRRVSEATGEEVSSEQITKGYEIAKGQYVIVEPEEIDAIKPKSTQTIEIEEFVDIDDIDPVYFQTPYYLAPDKTGTKPYRLLAEAMEGQGKAAIGRVVIRQKESLVAIRVVDGALVLQMMRYDDEVVPVADLAGIPGEEVEVSAKELAMANQLVEALAAEFEPGKYRNEYREQVMELIDKKAAGQSITAPAPAEPQAKVLDLMAALEASLAANKAKKDAPGDAAGGSSATEDDTAERELAPEEPAEPAEKPKAKRRTRTA